MRDDEQLDMQTTTRSTTPQTCWACGKKGAAQIVGDYVRCPFCGHETLRSGQTQTFMVNDRLSLSDVMRRDGLTKFQLDVVSTASPRKHLLIDIGSGSGKFLFHAKELFSRYAGVEISDASLHFSVDTLKLNVAENLPEDLDQLSAVTFWHSLEHIPAEALDTILAQLAAAADANTRIIVSVPNALSRQSRWFGRYYAYFDPPHHLHQFTPESLDTVFSRHLLRRDAQFVGWSYNGFGWLQGMLNLVFPIHNYLYYRLKRGRAVVNSPLTRTALDLANLLISALFALPALAASILDSLDADRGGVITYVYKLDRP